MTVDDCMSAELMQWKEPKDVLVSDDLKYFGGQRELVPCRRFSTKSTLNVSWHDVNHEFQSKKKIFLLNKSVNCKPMKLGGSVTPSSSLGTMCILKTPFPTSGKPRGSVISLLSRSSSASISLIRTTGANGCGNCTVSSATRATIMWTRTPHWRRISATCSDVRPRTPTSPIWIMWSPLFSRPSWKKRNHSFYQRISEIFFKSTRTKTFGKQFLLQWEDTDRMTIHK